MMLDVIYPDYDKNNPEFTENLSSIYKVNAKDNIFILTILFICLLRFSQY